MSIASEITRLQGVKSNILSAIADKGVSVPSGSALADCPELIASISGGGGSFSLDNLVNIVPIKRLVVVDPNGYIGYDLTDYFYDPNGIYYYMSKAVLSEYDDFSEKGLGQVTLATDSPYCIGGRVYSTVNINGIEWMSENLDYKFTKLRVGEQVYAYDNALRANYYDNDEATYGISGLNYGLLYNNYAVKYLEEHKAELIPGWHVPSTDEWDNLFNYAGGYNKDSTALKLKSTSGWNNNGTDDYGFCAKPGGVYASFGGGSSSFNSIGSLATYWTKSNFGNPSNSNNIMQTISSQVGGRTDGRSFQLFSLRLIKDS